MIYSYYEHSSCNYRYAAAFPKILENSRNSIFYILMIWEITTYVFRTEHSTESNTAYLLFYTGTVNKKALEKKA